MGNLDALGRYDGILGVPGLGVFGVELGQQRLFYLLVWALALLASLAVLRLLDSRTGRAGARAGRRLADGRGGWASTLLRYKIGIFVLAALFASVSGWLFAHFQRTVNPSPFGIRMGIEYLFMAVLGGGRAGLGRDHGLGRGQAARGPAADRAAAADRHERQLRGDRVRRAARARAQVPAGRPLGVRRPETAAGPPRTVDLARRAAAAHARRSPHRASCCSTCRRIRKTFGGLVRGQRRELPDACGSDRRADRAERRGASRPRST